MPLPLPLQLRSGSGNTVNANHPATQQQILDSLRWWVEEYHVDGFRFDLGEPFTIRKPWGSGLRFPSTFCGVGLSV